MQSIVSSETVSLLLGVLVTKQSLKLGQSVEALHLNLEDRTLCHQLIEPGFVLVFLVLPELSVETDVVIIE